MYKTARQAYIDILIELVKEETPVLYLEDYLYYYNKAISEYMKLRYEKFEVTQQLTDDLRAWKKVYETTDTVINIDDIGKKVTIDGKVVVTNPYRHLLNCIVGTETFRPNKHCGEAAQTSGSFKATRMTSTIKAGILNNDYLKPTFYRPYFDILDNKLTVDLGDSSDPNLKSSIIHIEYLKQPDYVNLEIKDITPAEEGVEDIDESQVLEFPQDVYEEILKQALKLILERGMNPRLASHTGVNQTVNDISMGGQRQ
jgi:hypothetical protein